MIESYQNLFTNFVLISSYNTHGQDTTISSSLLILQILHLELLGQLAFEWLLW